MRVGVVHCLGVIRKAAHIMVVLELAVLELSDCSRVDTVDSPYWEHLH